jgi:hypothetical protein
MTNIINLFIEKSVESLLKGSYSVKKNINNALEDADNYSFKLDLLEDTNLLKTIHDLSFNELKKQFKEEEELLDLIRKIKSKIKFNKFIQAEYIIPLKSFNFLIYQNLLFKCGFCSLLKNNTFFINFSFLTNREIRNLSFLNRNSSFSDFKLLNNYPILINFLIVQELSNEKRIPIIDLLLIDSTINSILKKGYNLNSSERSYNWIFYVNFFYKIYFSFFKLENQKYIPLNESEYLNYPIYNSIISFLNEPQQMTLLQFIDPESFDKTKKERMFINEIFQLNKVINPTKYELNRLDLSFGENLTLEKFEIENFYDLLYLLLKDLANEDINIFNYNSFDELLEPKKLLLTLLTRVKWPLLVPDDRTKEIVKNLFFYLDNDELIYHNLILILLTTKMNVKEYFYNTIIKYRRKIGSLPNLELFDKRFSWHDHLLYTLETCLSKRDLENFIQLVYLSDIDLFKTRSINKEEIEFYNSLFSYNKFRDNSNYFEAIRSTLSKFSEFFINHYRFYNFKWDEKLDTLFLKMIRSLVELTKDYSLIETINSIKTFKEF